MLSIRFLAGAGLVSAMLAVPASANEFSVSLGAGYAPQYRGADEYRFIPLPGFSWETDNFTLKTSRLGLEADLVPGPGFSAGPIVRYSFGRDPGEIDDNVVALLPEIDATLQAGGFVGAAIPLGDPSTNPLFLTARVEAMQALETDQGMTIDASIGLLSRSGEWTIGGAASIGWADEDHMDTFFGISPAASAASGLAAFDAGSGVAEYGLEAFVSRKLDDRWSVSGFGKWSRLTGDAADSPIVSQRGSDDQFFIGASIGYKLY